MPEDDEVAVRPGGVVEGVGGDEGVEQGEFGGGRGRFGEEGGGVAAAEPLAVGPDVVVLGVEGEDVCEEGELGGGEWGARGKMCEEGLTVVPVGGFGSVGGLEMDDEGEEGGSAGLGDGVSADKWRSGNKMDVVSRGRQLSRIRRRSWSYQI